MGLAILALKAAPVGVDVLAYIIILSQVEQLPDLGGPLGSPHAWLVVISQSRQVSWACMNKRLKIIRLVVLTAGLH